MYLIKNQMTNQTKIKQLKVLAETINILANKQLATVKDNTFEMAKGNISISCRESDVSGAFNTEISKDGSKQKGYVSDSTKPLIISIAQYLDFEINVTEATINKADAFCRSNEYHKTHFGNTMCLESDESEIYVTVIGEKPVFSELVLFKYLSELCNEFGLSLPAFVSSEDSGLGIFHETDTIILRNIESKLFALHNTCNGHKHLTLSLKEVLGIYKASYENEFKFNC